MAASVVDICRYPVKGLSAESLERVELTPGETLPHDRRFAIAHGSTQFDPTAPKWLPRRNFLMLMRDEKLALLRCRFDPDSNDLTIERGGKPVARGKASEPMGRMVIGQFFASFMAGASRGTPKLVEAPGISFADCAEKLVSIINLASVRDLERVMRVPLHPLRFRANLYIDGLPAWAERGWVGQEIEIGDARLAVRETIERCAATNVDPETGERDLNIPLALQRGFGHVTLGVYASVVGAGSIAKGDRLSPPA
ncbi:MAG: MOSC domain-containing protein [Kiloniellales bacterium]